ncbi:MAG: hypothetical protein O7A64_04410 [Alphaproteobacteria bacterium]|nr:hypothetical protein [Alphaproteobacteria bacterium]
MFTNAVPLDPQDIQKLEAALDPGWRVTLTSTEDGRPLVSITRFNGEEPMALWRKSDGDFRLVNYERDKEPHCGDLQAVIEHIF